MGRLAALVAALAALALAACGSPGELGERDSLALELARERAIAALEVERRLSESPAAAARTVARVRRVVASGALEARELDEFGLAALGELRLAAPHLVVVDRLRVPRALDREALTTFLARARTDPAAATRPAAAAAVDEILAVLDRSGAGPGSDIAGAGMTVDVYLADLDARLRPVWPALAARLAQARSRL